MFSTYEVSGVFCCIIVAPPAVVVVPGCTCLVVNNILPPRLIMVVDFGMEACKVPGTIDSDEIISIFCCAFVLLLLVTAAAAAAAALIVLPVDFWIICTPPVAAACVCSTVFVCFVVNGTVRTSDGGWEDSVTIELAIVPAATPLGSVLMTVAERVFVVGYANGGGAELTLGTELTAIEVGVAILMVSFFTSFISTSSSSSIAVGITSEDDVCGC